MKLTMKKLLPLICALGCIAQPAFAANNINMQSLAAATGAQTLFRDISEDLGSALSYKPITPAASLGVTGFDLGIEATMTDMKKSSRAWAAASGSTVSNLYVPKLHFAKGLPFNIDIAAFMSKSLTTNISLFGGELRYAIVEGGIATPTVAIRGSYTRLSGVNQLAFDTRGLDVSISKGFAMLSPYAGVGQVWVNSTPDVARLTAESFSLGKVFAGANLNLGTTNIAVECDKTGSAKSISAKIGFRF